MSPRIDILAMAMSVEGGNLTGTEAHVFLVLCTFGMGSGSMFPGNAALAARCCRSVRTVERALSSIVEKGWLARVRPDGGARYRYTVVHQTTRQRDGGDNVTGPTECRTPPDNVTGPTRQRDGGILTPIEHQQNTNNRPPDPSPPSNDKPPGVPDAPGDELAKATRMEIHQLLHLWTQATSKTMTVTKADWFVRYWTPSQLRAAIETTAEADAQAPYRYFVKVLAETRPPRRQKRASFTPHVDYFVDPETGERHEIPR